METVLKDCWKGDYETVVKYCWKGGYETVLKDCWKGGYETVVEGLLEVVMKLLRRIAGKVVMKLF